MTSRSGSSADPSTFPSIDPLDDSLTTLELVLVLGSFEVHFQSVSGILATSTFSNRWILVRCQFPALRISVHRNYMLRNLQHSAECTHGNPAWGLRKISLESRDDVLCTSSDYWFMIRPTRSNPTRGQQYFTDWSNVKQSSNSWTGLCILFSGYISEAEIEEQLEHNLYTYSLNFWVGT